MALQPKCTLMGLLTVHKHLIIIEIYITFNSLALSEPPTKRQEPITHRDRQENIYIKKNFFF